MFNIKCVVNACLLYLHHHMHHRGKHKILLLPATESSAPGYYYILAECSAGSYCSSMCSSSLRTFSWVLTLQMRWLFSPRR